ETSKSETSKPETSGQAPIARSGNRDSPSSLSSRSPKSVSGTSVASTLVYMARSLASTGVHNISQKAGETTDNVSGEERVRREIRIPGACGTDGLGGWGMQWIGSHRVCALASNATGREKDGST